MVAADHGRGGERCPAHSEHAQFVSGLGRHRSREALDLLDAVSKSYRCSPRSTGRRIVPLLAARLIHRLPPTWFRAGRRRRTTVCSRGDAGRVAAAHVHGSHPPLQVGALIRSGSRPRRRGRDVQNVHGETERRSSALRSADPSVMVRRRKTRTRRRWAAVRNIAGDMVVAIIHESTKIEFIESKIAGQSGELFTASLRLLRPAAPRSYRRRRRTRSRRSRRGAGTPFAGGYRTLR